jgi:hypothetical protein
LLCSQFRLVCLSLAGTCFRTRRTKRRSEKRARGHRREEKVHPATTAARGHWRVAPDQRIADQRGRALPRGRTEAKQTTAHRGPDRTGGIPGGTHQRLPWPVWPKPECGGRKHKKRQLAVGGWITSTAQSPCTCTARQQVSIYLRYIAPGTIVQVSVRYLHIYRQITCGIRQPENGNYGPCRR